MTRKAYRRKIIKKRRETSRSGRQTHLKEGDLKTEIISSADPTKKIIPLEIFKHEQVEILAPESPLERIRRNWKPKAVGSHSVSTNKALREDNEESRRIANGIGYTGLVVRKYNDSKN